MRTMLIAAALLSSTSAFAQSRPDLVTTITQPSGVHVYENGAWTFTVRNAGNKDAASVSLVIDLPQTHTSPTVYVMGEVITPLLYGPGYSGIWWQPTPQEISFEYYELGTLVATFHGAAVDGTSCFEGLTTFPGSTYISAYEVCF